MVFMKSSQVILFPYIIVMFQKEFYFFYLKDNRGGSKVPTRPACRTGRVGQDSFSLGVKVTKNIQLV